MKRVIGIAAFAACLVACGPSGKLSGTVRVLGGDPSKVTVMLQGEVTRAAAVDGTGAYAFEGLPEGVYVIEATAESTDEDRLTTRAEVHAGAGQVNELVFRGVGRVSGQVTSPTGVTGAQVFVAGQSIRVNVSEDGSFLLPKIPVGEQTVVAVLDGYAPSTAKVSVPFQGEVANQLLALTEVAHGEGQIVGRAYYFDRDDQSGITVRVEGTNLSAQTDKDGNYSVQGAPLGYVTLVAEAQGYQPARAVNVLSAAGGSLRAPDLRVSFVEQRFAGTINQSYSSPDGSTLLFSGIPEFDSSMWLYVIDLTGTAPAVPLMRLGFGGAFDVFWRADGKRAAVALGNRLYAVNLETNAVTRVTERFFRTQFSLTLVKERLFFNEATDSTNPPSPLLRVYDFEDETNQAIEQVSLAGPVTCMTGIGWTGGSFTVSADGAAAYFTPPQDGTGLREVHVWDGTTTSVSETLALDCVSWHAGSQLLGLQRKNATGLYNLTTGSPLTLVTLPAGALAFPEFQFTGNDQYAWFVDLSGSVPELKSVFIAGGPVNTLQSGSVTSTSPEVIAVQPGGDQLAFLDTIGNIVVKRADGTSLAMFQTSNAESAFWYGPQGRHFLFVLAADRRVSIANAADLQPKPIGEVYLYEGIYSPVSFSPREKAVVLLDRLPSGQYQWRLRRADDGAVLDLPFVTSLSSPQFRFSDTDRFVVISNGGGDRLVNLDTSAISNLQRTAEKLSADSVALFTGDESRLLFGDGSYGGSHAFSARTDDGSVRLAADSDTSSHWLQIPGSSRMAFVDNSAFGDPRGLYTVLAP